tara:strand:- start:213 stop:509 length:297 start_codon:yes stop_codon:yes gene_type:complete
LVSAARAAAGCELELTAGVIDSQSVKAAASPSLSGFDVGKRIKGRKRHIINVICSSLIACVVHTANNKARDGAPASSVSSIVSRPNCATSSRLADMMD